MGKYCFPCNEFMEKDEFITNNFTISWAMRPTGEKDIRDAKDQPYNPYHEEGSWANLVRMLEDGGIYV